MRFNEDLYNMSEKDIKFQQLKKQIEDKYNKGELTFDEYTHDLLAAQKFAYQGIVEPSSEEIKKEKEKEGEIGYFKRNQSEFRNILGI